VPRLRCTRSWDGLRTAYGFGPSSKDQGFHRSDDWSSANRIVGVRRLLDEMSERRNDRAPRWEAWPPKQDAAPSLTALSYTILGVVAVISVVPEAAIV
jgi:hypothetical protein